jgi:hypothetical protein
LASSVYSLPSKKLTLAEIDGCHMKDQCFHCDDNFTPGHKEVCKRLFVIEVIDDGEDPTSVDETGAPTISLQALTGLQLRFGKIM